MKDKKFEATVVVICLMIISFVIGLGIVISKNRNVENNIIDWRTNL